MSRGKVLPKQGSFIQRSSNKIDGFNDISLIEEDTVSQNVFSKLDKEDSESGIINLRGNGARAKPSTIHLNKQTVMNNYLVSNPIEESNFSFNEENVIKDCVIDESVLEENFKDVEIREED